LDEHRSAIAAPVTGRLIEQEIREDDLDVRVDGGIRHGRGLHERQVIEWSDPRLPAIKTTVLNYTEFGQEDAHVAVFTGAHLLEDAEGSWIGTTTGVAYADGSIDGQDILVGRGAYEGLYAIIHGRAESAPASGGITLWRGMILAGSPPPTPSPL
jgi:hypothetical protein